MIKLLYIVATVIAGLGWGISVIGVFSDRGLSERLLNYLSGHEVGLNFPLHYWLNMCSWGFFCVGVLFILSLTSLFGVLYVVVGALNISCGVVLVIFGIRNGFVMDVQVNDIVFLISTGMVIVFTGHKWHLPNPALKWST